MNHCNTRKPITESQSTNATRSNQSITYHINAQPLIDTPSHTLSQKPIIVTTNIDQTYVRMYTLLF